MTVKPKRLEDIKMTPEAERLFEAAVDRATAPGANRRVTEAKAARVPTTARIKQKDDHSMAYFGRNRSLSCNIASPITASR